MAFFATKSEYASWLRGAEETHCTFFSGLNEEDMDELEIKLQCIMCCNSRMKFIQISEEYLNRPWVRELLKSSESEIIYLPKVKFGYYLKVMERLLEGERYKLESSLKKEKLLLLRI